MVIEQQEQRPDEMIGQLAMEADLITDVQLAEALAEQMGLQVVKLEDLTLNADVLAQITEPMAQLYRIIPLSLKDSVLTIAMCDPQKLSILDELRTFLGYEVRPVVATEQSVNAALERYYASSSESFETLVADMEDDDQLSAAVDSAQGGGPIDLTSVEAIADSAPVRKLLNMVLLLAIKDRASDLHFEPFEDEFRIRVKADGVLYEMVPPPRHLAFAITTRIKVMSNLDIAERRLPQDGRIKATVDGVQNEYRVSVLPTQFGETVDIRVLTNSSILTGLSGLGMWDEEQAFIRKTLETPYGVILVTGPTGSGKTTSLYSFLNIMNETSRKIITIEDPIEYHLDGVTQLQVHPRIGLTFARGLRSMLRHDPDVMMVGEIRDQETAETVIRVALTGHLVFSTVHTNDAPSTPARLLNMGIEPYLLASSVRCILAQRLVRKICPECKEVDSRGYAKELAGELSAGGENIDFMTGAGCEKCHHTGFSGRTAIFEILPVTSRVQEQILAREPASALREGLTGKGTGTLRERGLALAARGETSVSEVLRVTAGQDGV